MAPDANFESTSYNPFTVNDNFLILTAIQILVFIDTKYFNPNEIREGFECLCENGLSCMQTVEV